MSNGRIIIIILFILSESVAAFYGAQAVWRSKARDGRRTTIGMLVAAGFVLYGCTQLYALFVSVQFARVLSTCVPPELERRSIIVSVLRVTAVWVMGWAYGSAASPGVIRTKVNEGLERLR